MKSGNGRGHFLEATTEGGKESDRRRGRRERASVMTRKDMQAVLVGETLTISSFWVEQGSITTGLSNQAIRSPLCPVVNGGPKLVLQRRPPPPLEEGRVSPGRVAGSFLKGQTCVGERDS